MENFSINSVTERLQAAALDPTLWHDCLTFMSERLQVAGIVLFSTDSHLAQPISSKTMLDSTRDYIENGWNLRDERYRGVPKVLQTGITTDLDFASEREISKSDYYQIFLRKHSLGLFAGVGFKAGHDLWVMSIQRYFGEECFTRRQLNQLKRLWRPLSDAATLSRQIGFSRALGVTDAYEHMKHPAVILSAELDLIAYNEKAGSLLGRLFEISRGKIQFLDIRSTNEFEALIRRLRAGALPMCSPVSMQVSTINGEKARIRLIELVGWSSYSFTNSRYIIIFDYIDYNNDIISVLQNNINLTQTESKIACAVAAGRSLFEIAAQAGISYETVRTHLRSIYSKSGVRRQAELVALISKFAIL